MNDPFEKIAESIDAFVYENEKELKSLRKALYISGTILFVLGGLFVWLLQGYSPCST